jgi:hypothetical protein
MGIIIEPKIVVDDIKLEINTYDKNGADNIINTWGPTMPMIKINDYILASGEIREFNLKIKINSLPKFTLTISDSNYNIRKALKKETIDKSVIFIGYKDWYLKFNGVILDSPSDAGDEILYLEGQFFNHKLYNSIQKSYNKLSILDTLKDICVLTDMGLFVYNNDSLSNILENNLNPNTKNIEFFNYNIQKFTNNIWCVDTFGYFHVSDIETLRKQKFDKFKLFEGKINDVEKDIIITTNIYDENKEKNKFMAEYYTINSNIGNVYVNNNNKYNVKSAGLNPTTKDLKTNNIGISTNSENTFDRFSNSFFPYYKDIINKDIGGKVVNLSMKNLIYELTPFSIVNLEIYLPKKENKFEIDKENSGKKIVIGYEFNYSAREEDTKYPTIKQLIDLI